MLNRFLDLRDRLIARQHTADREEAGLHDRVDAIAHADCLCATAIRVDRIDLDLLGDNCFLDRARQLVPNLFRFVRTVQQERRAIFGRIENLVTLEEIELVARR